MPEKLNIVCRDNGECISIVHPGTGCTDVIGVGHAGAMSYYRVRYNKSFALKINKTCVSSNDICNPREVAATRLQDVRRLPTGLGVRA